MNLAQYGWTNTYCSKTNSWLHIQLNRLNKPRTEHKSHSQSTPLTENWFEPLLNLVESTDHKWAEFDKKLKRSTRRITQNTTCKGNVSIEINKLSTETFKSKSKNNKIVSLEHREHLLHTRDGHNKDVDMMFKSFLNTHLRIFYSSFPKIKSNERVNNSWSTMGIKTCLHKRFFYLLCRDSNDYFKKLLQTMLQNFDKWHKWSKKIYVQ
jgi:hypothetical protein